MYRVVVNFAKKNNYPQQGGWPMVRNASLFSQLLNLINRQRFYL